MADVSAQPIPDFGNLISSYGQNQAQIGQANANTALAGAQVPLVQAQAGLVNQQAQKAGFEVQMIKNAMEAMKNIGPTSGSEQSGDQSPVDPTELGVQHSLQQKFGFVDPMGPPGLQQYINATAWVNPAESQRAEEWRKMIVARNVAKNQSESNDIFQTASTLDTNPSKSPLTSLLSLQDGTYLKNVGTAIASDSTKSPAEKDQAAAVAIKAAADNSHQYTGRELAQSGDQWVDKLTGRNVNAPKIGLTTEQQAEFGKWIKSPVTVTVNGRETQTTPEAFGVRSPEDLLKLGAGVKFSIPPPGSSAASAAPQGAMPRAGQAPGQVPQSPTPAQAQAAGIGQQGQGQPGAPGQPPQGQSQTPPGMPPQVAALQDPKQRNIAQVAIQQAKVPPDQAAWVAQRPDGYTPPPSNSKPNSQDDSAFNTWKKQATDLAKVTGSASNEAQDTLTSINRIKSTLTADPRTGPGAAELAKARTFMSQWFGTDEGQAASYQVLSKFLNAEQMTGILKQFHGDGAQVRLGAYESRLIMEQLAANPQMTKQAINQMINWQSSDAQYSLTKGRAASAAVATKRDVSNFDTDYNSQFPKSTNVDTTFAGMKHAADPRAEQEALTNPKLMPIFVKTYGYTPTRPSAPTAQELGK